MQRRSKPRIGNIIEIQTPRGLAYAQYSHYLPGEGDLIRVLPGLHAETPGSFEELVAAKERFFVFYPVGAAVKQNLVSVVAEAPVPEETPRIPLDASARSARSRRKSGRLVVAQWQKGVARWSAHP